MNQPLGRFVVTQSDEFWNGFEDFRLREEAVSFGLGEFGGEAFYTGTVEPVDRDYLVAFAINGDSIAEALSEAAYEQVGEVAEGWLDTEKMAELESTLRAATRKWFDDAHPELPFWKVVNITQHGGD